MSIKLILFSLLFLFFGNDTYFTKKSQSHSPKIIIAVFAHADDETNIAPLLSNYARKGYLVYLVVATNGNKGIKEHAGIPAGDSLAKTRKTELICTAQTLKIQPPIFLEFNDGTLANSTSSADLSFLLLNLFEKIKPDAVITWGPEGGYGHTDHRMVHNIVSEIFQSGKSSWPQQLFYTGIPTEHKTAQSTFSTPTIKWLFENWKTVKKEWLTVRIKCDEQDWLVSQQALRCNQSQFTAAEMEEAQLLLKKISKDTIYLRPFLPSQKISTTLF